MGEVGGGRRVRRWFSQVGYQVGVAHQVE